MSVDFTNKKKEKTNEDYLKEILSGNDEGLEFLLGFKKDYENLLEDLQDELNEKKIKIDENDDIIRELNDSADYEDVIDTRMGGLEGIRWSAPNLSAKLMMEELNEAISRGVSLMKIGNVLRSL